MVLDKRKIKGGIEYDLTDLAGIPKLIASLGEIDVLVNNAGVLYCPPHDAFTGHPDLWYGATKAALLNITKSYAGYLGKDGILVNAVAPGPTLTAMYQQLPQSRKDAVERSVYSGRAAKAEEVAQAIFWLGSSSPDYLSGTTVDVNNGSYPR